MKIWKKTAYENTPLQVLVEKFTVGDDYLLDQALVPYDVQASIAHAEGLYDIGILNETELMHLSSQLKQIKALWEQDKFTITVEEEDCHTAIENHLIQIIGVTGKKIHTGRSRNDQVLVAMRLWEKYEWNEIILLNKKLVQKFITFAQTYEFMPMPGFTHTQIAMPSSVGMWAGSLAEMLIMNGETLKSYAHIIDKCPLGSAAGFGTHFNLPRQKTAQKLGFDDCLILSLTSQNTRGKIEADLVSHLSSLSGTLAHFANDLVWYTSTQFQYFSVNESLTTGSSIMPQKKNLDPAELLRAKHAEILGHAFMLKNLTNGLTSGYHRDLQLSKAPTMKAFATIKTMLEIAGCLIDNLSPIEANLRAAFVPNIFAADAANEMVKNGIPFRDAYLEVGNNLGDLTLVDIDENLKSKTHLGSTGNLGLELLQQQLNQL